jgi:hypothetical protein
MHWDYSLPLPTTSWEDPGLLGCLGNHMVSEQVYQTLTAHMVFIEHLKCVALGLSEVDVNQRGGNNPYSPNPTA